jgi:hypothetical protein
MTDPITRPTPVFKKTGTLGIRVASEAKEDHRTMAPRAASLLFTCKGYYRFLLTLGIHQTKSKTIDDKQINPHRQVMPRTILENKVKNLGLPLCFSVLSGMFSAEGIGVRSLSALD